MGAAEHHSTQIAEGAWRTGAPDTPQRGVVGRTHGDEPVGAQGVEAPRRAFGEAQVPDGYEAERARTLRGALGLTVESGRGTGTQALEAARAVASRAVGRDWSTGEDSQVYAARSVLRAPWSGLAFQRALGNGRQVEAGEVLARRAAETLQAPGVVLLAHDQVEEGAAAALFAEDLGQVAVEHAAWRALIG